MADTYDIKWKNDLRMYMDTFRSFVLEGNINDLQPIDTGNGVDYVSMEKAIAEMYSEDYCVVFYDHTKQNGDAIDEDNDTQDVCFKSFNFYEDTIFSGGEGITSPNVELFKQYYLNSYMENIQKSEDKRSQGGKAIDFHRILDAMKDFDEKQKDPEYAEAKPFMFILPSVSRYMTSPGRPDGVENSILMLLFNATQVEKTKCKLIMLVDKINDLPTWFESEGNNPALKKLYVPTPDSKFRETFYEVEMKDVMDPIAESEVNAKILKFSAYTENFSLRRLRQLKLFIQQEADRVEDNVPSLRKIENIDKTVMLFDSGKNKDPWRDPKLMKRIEDMSEKSTKEILGQNWAIAKTTKSLRIAATGVKSSKKNDRRPRAVLFFAGPTGVGKTELTKQIAKNIFQNQDSMIRFDMSEFREEHTDARLFGAPPGYVGYEAGGELTRAVKQNPFTVILFDEIEKAAPRIWDKFLQILGDGRLTDGKGETVSFTQSIIVFTSNLGITADPVSPEAMSKREDDILETIGKIKAEELIIETAQDEKTRKEAVKRLYELYFSLAVYKGLTCDLRDDYIFQKCYQDLGEISPDAAFNKYTSECVIRRINSYFERIGRREILGRIGDDNILAFNFMTPKIAENIAENTINNYIATMREEHECRLIIGLTDEAKQFIKSEVKKTEVLNLGGRQIVATVEKLISEPVSEFLATSDNLQKRDLSVTIDVEYGCLFAR